MEQVFAKLGIFSRIMGLLRAVTVYLILISKMAILKAQVNCTLLYYKCETTERIKILEKESRFFDS